MRYAKADRTTLIVNDSIGLAGISPEAHGYVVNRRTPLKWLMNRYRTKTDEHSGITDDPNGWFADPRDLVPAIERVVPVSLKTPRIVAGVPASMETGPGTGIPPETGSLPADERTRQP